MHRRIVTLVILIVVITASQCIRFAPAYGVYHYYSVAFVKLVIHPCPRLFFLWNYLPSAVTEDSSCQAAGPHWPSAESAVFLIVAMPTDGSAPTSPIKPSSRRADSDLADRMLLQAALKSSDDDAAAGMPEAVFRCRSQSLACAACIGFARPWRGINHGAHNHLHQHTAAEASRGPQRTPPRQLQAYRAPVALTRHDKTCQTHARQKSTVDAWVGGCLSALPACICLTVPLP
jgi:hypothetical protein